jgi:probable F420-dependent oxidoreductase
MLIAANLILNDRTLPMRVVAPLVEDHGLDAIFLGEHTHTPIATVHPEMPDGLPEFYKRFLDPFVQLAVAATLTERIRIGTGVVLVTERNPLELAKALASLDVISGGRLDVGVGYGWNPLELINSGIAPSTRRAVFREKLTAVRRLWTEEVTGFDGEFVHFSESYSYPKPLQKPNPPVLIGAGASTATFDDVVELGEGWYPLGSDQLPDQMKRLAMRNGGILPPVTAVEMEGQRPGTPWYWEDPEAHRSLEERVQLYADSGMYRLSVGVPADERDQLVRALESLGTLAEKYR